MNGYISIEAATEAVWEILNGLGYSQKHCDRLVEDVDAALEERTAADVRHVVTCKDCYYADYSGMGNGTVWCNELEHAMQEDDFCSRGKREES